MRKRLLSALPVLLLACAATTSAGQTALQLRWELVADTQAAFILTNRDGKPLPPTGWAIYFSALHSADSASVGSGFAIQDVMADLQPLFPPPVQVTRGTGELRLTAMPQVTAPAELANEAALAAEYLRPYFRARGQGAAVPLRIEVGTVQGQSSPEAYELVIDSAAGIRIVGVSSAGVFYGLQSLRTLLPPPSPRGGLVLPALRVVDAPRFGYRGFMLDVARNFHPKAAVLRTLDLMARYKLNVFHMHLTDDEGWRVEIPSLPDLTAVGGRRGHTLDSREFLQPAFGSGPRSEEHTSELQSRLHLVCRLLLEKKKTRHESSITRVSVVASA